MEMSTPHPRSLVRASNSQLVTRSYIRVERKPIGGGDQRLEDAGFAECMASHWCDLEFRFRPALIQLIRGDCGSGNVVASLNDYRRNSGQSIDVGDQLTFSEPAAVEEIVVLDARESQGKCRIAEVGDHAFILLQSDGCSLPDAPCHAGRPVYSGIRIEQQVVVCGNRVPGEGATAQ